MRRFNPKWVWGLPLLLVFVAGPALAVARPSDTTISFWVSEALRQDPRVESSHVNVKTTDGTVTLSGEVRNMAARRFADLETKKVDGVKGVINEIIVNPEYRDDYLIAADVRRRLTDSPLDALHRVEVTSLGGVLTLRGDVPSWSEKREAELLASEVLGVREVHNDLTLHYASTRSDMEIQKDVEAAISRDVYLAGLPIEVQVNQGVVKLTGSVGSAYVDDRATEDAWVENVKKVENRLDVKWWENRGVREAPAVPTDAQICSAVETDLLQDLRIVDPFGIEAQCTGGHLTLHGKVPTYHEKLLAERDAQDVVGVGWVTNDLVVQTGWREASAIKSDIMDRFDGDYRLNGQDLMVRVKDGVVTLKGSTNTSFERQHAMDVAARVPGVMKVVNDIKVDWNYQYTDQTLKQHIQDRLKSHDATKWVADSIKLKVDDGRVILTGDVPLWSERKEVARIAFMTDGVRSVDNRMTVEGIEYPWDEWYSSPFVVHDFDYFYEPFYPAG
jgi:osmotically-inducible protein OsmY